MTDTKKKKIKLVMGNFNTNILAAFFEQFETIEAKRLWNRFEFAFTPNQRISLNITNH